MKKILTIQDLSCLGKCSLTVALPILSALGLETTVLPTAVLSTHTAFPDPKVCDLSENILPFGAHWCAQGAEFDGMYVGYLGTNAQVEAVLKLREEFPQGLLFVDPVMGDHGKLYSRFDMDYVAAMRRLCAQADVIAPNLTEACLLANRPYEETPSVGFLQELMAILLELGCGCVVITGVSFTEGKTGAVAALNNEGIFVAEADKLPQSYHGTGDIFASVCAGSLVKGAPLDHALQLAVDFTARCIGLTVQPDARFGVQFEKALPYLFGENP